MEVWDSNGPLIKGDFLGRVELPSADLLSGEDGKPTVVIRELSAKEGLTAHQQTLVQGEISLQMTKRPKLTDSSKEGILNR